MEKLFIVVRSDLSAGAQCAQACHALRAFVSEHPELDRAWHGASKNLVVLSARDEAHLADLVRLAGQSKIACASFREPDFDDALTAVALGCDARRMLSSLPLALRGEKLTRDRSAA